MFCLSNKHRSTGLSLVTDCRSFLWRQKVQKHLFTLEFGEKIKPQVIMMDAPSGYGKTRVVKVFAEKRKEHNIKVISCEFLVDKLTECILSHNRAARNEFLRDLFSMRSVW